MTRRRVPPQPTPGAQLLDELRILALGNGIDALGTTTADPLVEARREIERRRDLGLADSMKFTFAKPERSTSPAGLLPNAKTVIVAARSYRRADVEPGTGPQGRIARYAWIDHYAPLKAGLNELAARLKREGFRTRVLADDNALVDRAVAYRAGIGWLGKNANLLLPGRGSWFVLGALVTSAELPVNNAIPVDGCGSCVRCIDGCPTGAIVEPGVVDARRCLAWLVQRPGVFPEEFAEALADRVYGCDDCQEVCPPNRAAERRSDPPAAEAGSLVWSPLLDMATATDGELLARHGRFYVPDRDPSTLRRNALLALGNVADPTDDRVLAVVDGARSHRDEGVRVAAAWALERLQRRRARKELH